MRIDEIKTELKAEHPTIRRGSDEVGYTQLDNQEYEAMIQSWAEAALAKEEAKAAELAKYEAKVETYKKLGLNQDEIDLILPAPRIYSKNVGGN